jgi:hypothetical protein
LLDEVVEVWEGRDKRYVPRRQLREEASEFFLKLYNAPIDKVACENPNGHMNTTFRKPDQIVHPYEHGHGVQKQHGLWLRNLPKLVPTNEVPGRKMLWWFQKPGQNRWKIKSRTFPGIAEAMAEQWGSYARN